MKPPSESFTRKISRLVVALAILICSVIWHAPTARDEDIGEVSDSAVKPLVDSLLPRKARVLQRILEPGPSWRFYCTLKRLPFRARRWRRQATEVSRWMRRRRIPLLRPFGPGSISFHKLTSAPWAAPSRGRGRLLCQFHVICAESSGFQRRRSRGWLASFLGKEVAAKQTEVSCWLRRRLEPIIRPFGPVPSVPIS